VAPGVHLEGQPLSAEDPMLRAGRALLLATTVLATPVLAQGPGTNFGGLIGGASLSDLGGYFGGSTTSRWGGTAGAFVGHNAGRTALMLEGYWIQKGGGDPGDVHLDYIEVPVTFGAIAVTGAGAARGRIYTGIGIGFKVSCSTNSSAGVACDDANGTEWTWPIGFQIASVKDNGTFFGVDIRYSFALNDAFDAIDAYNRPWQFRLMFGKQLGTSGY
jgi:hypothetical protein